MNSYNTNQFHKHFKDVYIKWLISNNNQIITHYNHDITNKFLSIDNFIITRGTEQYNFNAKMENKIQLWFIIFTWIDMSPHVMVNSDNFSIYLDGIDFKHKHKFIQKIFNRRLMATQIKNNFLNVFGGAFNTPNRINRLF